MENQTPKNRTGQNCHPFDSTKQDTNLSKKCGNYWLERQQKMVTTVTSEEVNVIIIAICQQKHVTLFLGEDLTQKRNLDYEGKTVESKCQNKTHRGLIFMLIHLYLRHCFHTSLTETSIPPDTDKFCFFYAPFTHRICACIAHIPGRFLTDAAYMPT